MSKPLLYNCEVCHYNFELCRQSILLVFFTEPLVDHILATCPNCDEVMLIWNISRRDVRDLLRGNRSEPIKVKVEEVAHQEVWRKYAKAMERMNEICARMAHRLERELP